jgi:hypothetical protein
MKGVCWVEQQAGVVVWAQSVPKSSCVEGLVPTWCMKSSIFYWITTDQWVNPWMSSELNGLSRGRTWLEEVGLVWVCLWRMYLVPHPFLCLSASWPSWGEQSIPSFAPVLWCSPHFTPKAMEPAIHGLKPRKLWGKTNLSSLMLFISDSLSQQWKTD